MWRLGWGRLAGAGDAPLPHADLVVGVAGEQSLAVSGPGERGDLGRLGAGGAGDLGPEVLHQVLALQVPDLDAGPGGGAQPVPVGREGEAVKISGVADVVGLQLAVGQVPHLDVLVPPARHDDRVGGVGGEAHAADPVAVALVLDGVLALGERVPQLDALVAARGHDLPVVHGEGHGQHVLGVVLEPAGRLAG